MESKWITDDKGKWIGSEMSKSDVNVQDAEVGCRSEKRKW